MTKSLFVALIIYCTLFMPWCPAQETPQTAEEWYHFFADHPAVIRRVVQECGVSAGALSTRKHGRIEIVKLTLPEKILEKLGIEVRSVTATTRYRPLTRGGVITGYADMGTTYETSESSDIGSGEPRWRELLVSEVRR